MLGPDVDAWAPPAARTPSSRSPTPSRSASRPVSRPSPSRAARSATPTRSRPSMAAGRDDAHDRRPPLPPLTGRVSSTLAADSLERFGCSVRPAAPTTMPGDASVTPVARRSRSPVACADRPTVRPRDSAVTVGRGSRVAASTGPVAAAPRRRRARPGPGGAPARLRPVRRPRRLHDARRRLGSGAGARPADPLLRDRARHRRAIRRHHREVHRRRRHGGLGRPDRPRRRRRARRPGRPRAGRSRPGPRALASRAGRRPDGRGGRRPRCHEPGDGRGRPRQHREPPPVRRTARHGPRRRSHRTDRRPRRSRSSRPASSS